MRKLMMMCMALLTMSQMVGCYTPGHAESDPIRDDKYPQANGQALDPDPTWHYRAIEPKVKTILQGSAPDIGAVDWRCEIRKDRAERKRTLWRWY